MVKATSAIDYRMGLGLSHAIEKYVVIVDGVQRGYLPDPMDALAYANAAKAHGLPAHTEESEAYEVMQILMEV